MARAMKVFTVGLGGSAHSCHGRTLLVWTLRLLIAGAGREVPADSKLDAGDIVWPLVILAFAFVGALVASRHPDNPIGWIFCGGAVAFSLSGLGGGIRRVHGLRRAGVIVRRWEDGGLVLGVGVGPGRHPAADPVPVALPKRRAALAALADLWSWLALAAIAFLVVGIAFSRRRVSTTCPEVENPVRSRGCRRRRLRCASRLWVGCCSSVP